MNKIMRKNPFAGFQSTPILATLTFIFGLCLFLDHTISLEDSTSLTCTAGVYRVGTGFEESQRLEMMNTGNGVNVSLSFFKGDQLTNKIMARGTVKKVQAPILSYEIQLVRGQHLKRLLQNESSATFHEVIEDAKFAVADNHSEPFLIKVLEMNKAAGVVTLQVEPNNNLWACKIQS